MTEREKEYNAFLQKRETIMRFGLREGFIKPYDDKLIENLRDVYYGGIPASIIILCEELCDGSCYDRAALITMGFGEDDFCLVRADINSLKLNPQHTKKEQHNHCFAERKMQDGKTWVYDTSAGAVFEKSLYYQIEEPLITKTSSKSETQDFLKDVFSERDKHKDEIMAMLVLPKIEKIANSTRSPYKQKLLNEIHIFKDKINFDKQHKTFDGEVNKHVEEFGNVKK